MAVGCLIALVTYWRLAAAYRLYLKFDHPRATVAASQVIVLLVLFLLAVNALQGFR